MSTLIGPLLSSIEGAAKNSTLLAYGQTGSGKTHTLFGSPGSLTMTSVAKEGGKVSGWGVIPIAMMNAIEMVGGTGKVRVSAKEVYGNKVYDLLDNLKPLAFSSAQGTGLGVGNCRVATLDGSGSYGGTHPPGCRCGDCWKAKEKAKKERMEMRNSGAFKKSASIRSMGRTGNEVEEFRTIGEKLVEVTNLDEIVDMCSVIEATRSSKAHLLNDRSSRSHCVVTVHLTTDTGHGIRHQTLTLCDLAGSERIKISGSSGVAAKEAASINGSLTVLGRVVNAKRSGADRVPYRDSALTMILRGSFEGGGRVGVVICLRDGQEHVEESICSAKFGERMGRVKTRNVSASVVSDAGGEEIEAIRRRLKREKEELKDMKKKGGGGFVGGGKMEKKGYTTNLKKREAAGRNRTAVKVALAEAMANGGKEGIEAARARLEKVTLDYEVIDGLCKRQESIKGFVKKESRTVQEKKARIRDLEQRLLLVTL